MSGRFKLYKLLIELIIEDQNGSRIVASVAVVGG